MQNKVSGRSPIKEETESSTRDGAGAIELQEPLTSDSPALYELVDICKPLDLNSPYCYMLIAEHFRATSIVVRSGDRIGGFISAYLLPGREDTLFVWQVAVHPDFRKQGLAARMIHGILERPVCSHVSYIETTVTPSNGSSRRLFYHVADDLKTGIKESLLFHKDLFGEEGEHEDEVLFRIGPFSVEKK